MLVNSLPGLPDNIKVPLHTALLSTVQWVRFMEQRWSKDFKKIHFLIIKTGRNIHLGQLQEI